MKKYRIQIIKLGNQRYDYVFNKLAKYKSKIFDITIFEKLDLPDTDAGWAYSTNKIKEILCPCYDSKKYDICIGFIDYKLHGNDLGNCYGSNIKDNKVFVLSFFQIAEFLAIENIELLNYVLIGIYRYLTRSIMKVRIMHDETRGCINDMCGIKTEIVYSCKKPILCAFCESRMRDKTFPDQYIGLLKNELKKIKKNTYYQIADFIKKHPILSILIGALSTIILGLITNVLYNLFMSKI